MAGSIWSRLAVGTAVVAVLGGGAWFAYTRVSSTDLNPEAVVTAHRGDLEIVVTETGRIQPMTKVDIKSKVAGQVMTLSGKEGQKVKPGDVLLELDPRDFRRHLAQAEADHAMVAAELNGLLAGARREDLEEARANLAQARARARRTQDDRDRAAKALSANSLTPQEWSQARGAADEAQAGVAAAQSKLNRLQAGARVAEVQQARARLRKADVELQSARDQLAYCVIRSPIAGTIIHRGIQVGEMVTPGVSETGNREPLLTVADLSSLVVQSDINQIDVGKLAIGQTVAIRVDTLPGESFNGEVYKVAPAAVAGRERDVQLFPMETIVRNGGGGRLRPGMSADLDIFIAKKANALLLPVEAVTREKGGVGKVTFVRKGRDNKWVREARTVRLGASSDQEVEVIAGLADGDRVLIDPASAKDNVNKF
ncbi:MAG: putative rane protein [Cyanobacteria bacterium RYN_339]|nr:putative rane protein [Cyanobacteria bacterium RYN_339]